MNAKPRVLYIEDDVDSRRLVSRVLATHGYEVVLAAGCTGFLTKPIDVDRLPTQGESFLKGHKHTLQPQILTQSLERHAQEVVLQLEAKVRELEKINERLYRLDWLKSDFVILASHELGTPLTLVSGYSQLLEIQLEQLQSDELDQQALNDLWHQCTSSIRVLSVFLKS